MEKEKKVVKLQGERDPGCLNLTGFEYNTLPAPELGTGRSGVRMTLLFFRWASPRSFKLLRVRVPKSNSVVAEILTKSKKKQNTRRWKTDETLEISNIID
ncbi:hypothetical protein SLE2022_077150 [Rubroshorea leprosula]